MPLPPPPGMDSQGSDVQDVPQTTGEKIVGGIGSRLAGAVGLPGGFESTQTGKTIAAHHQQRLADARRHHDNAQTYSNALSQGELDPNTHEPTGVDPNTGKPMTPEQRAQYRQMLEGAWGDYTKIAGVSKEAKQTLQQKKGLIDLVVNKGHKAVSALMGKGGGSGSTPSTGGDAPAQPAPGGGGGLTPPPKAQTEPGEASPASNSSPYDSRAQLDAPRLRQRIAANQEFSDWKRQQDVLHQHKLEEQKATAEAKAQSAPRSRPVHSGTLGVLDARKLSDAGQVFIGSDGDPLDLSKLDDSMGLYGMVEWSPDAKKWETHYYPISPNQRTVTVGNETYAVSPMDVSKLTSGAGVDLGQHNVPKSSTHQAIAIGPNGEPTTNTLTSTSTPSAPGIPGRGKGAPAASAATAPSAAPGISPPPSKGASSSGSGTRKPPASVQSGAHNAHQSAIHGLPPGTYNQMLQRVTPVRLAATQLFGDSENKNFKPLSSYASIVDDPAARDRVATAWNLIRDHMDQAGAGTESHGDLVTLMRNYFGTPGAVAESEVQKMKDTMDSLKPREEEMLNRLFSTYGTVIGLRSLTKGSAAKFSARNMEQEVPIPGMNVRNSRAFYDKLGTLAEEVNSGWKGIPEQMLTPGERDYDMRMQQELSGKAGGGSGKGKGKGITPPPGGSGKPMSTQDILRKHGVIP